MKKFLSAILIVSFISVSGSISVLANEETEKDIEMTCQDMALENGLEDEDIPDFLKSCKEELKKDMDQSNITIEPPPDNEQSGGEDTDEYESEEM